MLRRFSRWPIRTLSSELTPHSWRRWVRLFVAVTFLSHMPAALAQWTEPVPMEPQLGTAVRGPWISNDNLRLYAAGGGYIYVTERDSSAGPWHPWHSVGAHINSGIRQESPCESPTGDTLYFMSWERPEGTYGSYDIYYCARTDTGWGPVTNCGPNINGVDDEWSVGISRDGGTLLISAYRFPGGGGRDLFYSHKQADQTWGPLISFPPTISTNWDQEHPSMSPDTVSLYYSIDGQNGGDIWRSRFQDSSWQLSQQLPAPVNTPGREFDACIAADGRTLWFTRQDTHFDNAVYYSIDTTVNSVGAQPFPRATQPNEFTIRLLGDGDFELQLHNQSRQQTATVTLFNVLGRQLNEQQIVFLPARGGLIGQFRQANLPVGTYFFRVSTPTVQFQNKLVLVSP
jgi:hypothetical protein